jgi:type II secretory pathway pseudopilin PulG
MTERAEPAGRWVLERPRVDAASGLAERGRRPFRVAAAVLLIGLVITGALTWVSSAVNTNNEKRLLELRGKELGAVLAEAIPNVQTPLASAAALADATGGNPQKFEHFIAPSTGAPPGHEFVSVSLWRTTGGHWSRVVVVGAAPVLTSSSTDVSGLFERAAATHKLTVAGIVGSTRLGYAYSTSTRSTGRYAVYGEAMIPANRRSRLESNEAFSELNYAIYLGRAVTNRSLLVTSLKHPPIEGRHTTLRVPFGDAVLTLVVAAREPLGGTLPQRLPWVILAVGIILSAGAALMTLRLQRAVYENRRLYSQQRTIAHTLQQALLPDTLPNIPGLRVSGRYEAGSENLEIGGDWYDLIPLEDGRVLLVVGDVAGKGLPAATAMAALRFAIHAYAAQGDTPTVFLPKLSRLLSVTEDRLLATVLCAVVDVAAHKVTVTSAGHLPLLITSSEGSAFVATPPGLPVGVEPDPSYTSTTVSAPRGAALLAFTDGLVERRGESIEVGLERLRTEVSSDHVALDELLTRVLDQLGQDAFDDTAVAGIQWLS